MLRFVGKIFLPMWENVYRESENVGLVRLKYVHVDGVVTQSDFEEGYISTNTGGGGVTR